jgi:hypothetical protein
MYQWGTLALAFQGWSLKELKDMSPRERTNWLEIAKAVKFQKKSK